MKRWLTFPLVQILLCVAVYALVGYYFGKFAIVTTSPLFAAAVARPLWALVFDIWRGMRARVWLPVHGHHFVFKGTTVQVVEDESHFRWVSLSDVKKVLGSGMSDGAFAMAYPGRFRIMDKPAGGYLRDDALVAYLSKGSEQTTVRFKTWVERNIVLPGGRIRKNLGIRDEVPEPDERPPSPTFRP